jgi:hypothetical protein
MNELLHTSSMVVSFDEDILFCVQEVNTRDKYLKFSLLLPELEFYEGLCSHHGRLKITAQTDLDGEEVVLYDCLVDFDDFVDVNIHVESVLGTGYLSFTERGERIK